MLSWIEMLNQIKFKSLKFITCEESYKPVFSSLMYLTNFCTVAYREYLDNIEELLNIYNVAQITTPIRCMNCFIKIIPEDNAFDILSCSTKVLLNNFKNIKGLISKISYSEIENFVIYMNDLQISYLYPLIYSLSMISMSTKIVGTSINRQSDNSSSYIIYSGIILNNLKSFINKSIEILESSSDQNVKISSIYFNSQQTNNGSLVLGNFVKFLNKKSFVKPGPIQRDNKEYQLEIILNWIRDNNILERDWLINES